MTRLTTAQTVASGVASLILFSGTLFAGYALAGDGEAMSASAMPAAISATNGAPTTTAHD